MACLSYSLRYFYTSSSCIGDTSLVGAPCGGWVEAIGFRGRALLANGGCVPRGGCCCFSGCVLGGNGGAVSCMAEWWV